ncbi:hypothetical protein, partial [Allosphingosinicella sp.]|uniref:hypothetical protein n=1 Tax=Allosphingosinicella sp. TaxID=2823234 RepID=UPI002F1FC562
MQIRDGVRISTVVRRVLFILLLGGLASPALGQKERLGTWSFWGAFREPGRCFAIAEPHQAPSPEGWRPFASVGYWPGRGLAGQVHVRLSRSKRPGSAVLLRIDGRSFQLLAGERDAWGPNARADSEITAAMRAGVEMVVETRSAR